MDRSRPSTVQLNNDGSVSVLTDPGLDRPQSDCVPVMQCALGLFFREARVKLGVPARRLSVLCGVSEPVISRFETGKRSPSLSLVWELCLVAGIRLSDVMRPAEDEAFPLGNNPWRANSTYGLASVLAEFDDGRAQSGDMAGMVYAVGPLLRVVRLRGGWSARVVAELCGLSASVLSRLETGRRVPRVWQVLRLCLVLGIRFSDLIRCVEDYAFSAAARSVVITGSDQD